MNIRLGAVAIAVAAAFPFHLPSAFAQEKVADTVVVTATRQAQRESEVLLWIARGKSNRDIGEILGLSPRTVNKHLEQVYAKLGVENRASAAIRAVQVLQSAPDV